MGNSTSECFQHLKNRYNGLRPKKYCVLKQTSSSESSVHSEYDSESDYLPSNKDLICYTSDKISCKSDINLDKFYDINNLDIYQPSTSEPIKEINQKDILNNEVMESTKIIKKGYKFNASIETSKIKQMNNKRSWDKTTVFIAKKM